MVTTRKQSAVAKAKASDTGKRVKMAHQKTKTARAPRVPKTPFPFLKLPQELRDEVYKHYIRNAFNKVLPKYWRKRSTIPFDEKRHRLKRNSLALMLVNKQVHSETSDMVFRLVHPSFDLYDYMPKGKDGETPGILCGEASKEKYYEPVNLTYPFRVNVESLRPEFVAKFRKLTLNIYTSPTFPSRQCYNLLRDALQRIQQALVQENATASTPIMLTLKWIHLQFHGDVHGRLVHQVFDQMDVQSTRKTLTWMFEDLPNITVYTRLSNRGMQIADITYDADFNFDSDLDPGERVFEYTNCAHRAFGTFRVHAHHDWAEFMDDDDSSMESFISF